MEILSPAGNPNGFAAAVEGSCNAVYLVGKNFVARAFADNFTDYQLEGVVNYTHDRGIKVHVAVNTSVKNREMSDAVSFVRFLKDIGVDAVLMQDLGLMECIGGIDILKHAFTQTQVHYLKSLEWCVENGFDCAVLARKLTMDKFRGIISDSPIERRSSSRARCATACPAYVRSPASWGGRSSNHGSCTQPCRKRYESPEGSGYLLNCVYLFRIDHIEAFRGIGVTSFKIEWRMRSPTYAYLSVKIYSMAEDGDFSEEYTESLELLRTVFNHDTYAGYLDEVASSVQSFYPDKKGFRLGREEPISIKDGISIFDGDAEVGGFKVLKTHPIRIQFKISDGRHQIYRIYDPRIDVVKNKIGRTPRLNGNTSRRRVDMELPGQAHRFVRPESSF